MRHLIRNHRRVVAAVSAVATTLAAIAGAGGVAGAASTHSNPRATLSLSFAPNRIEYTSLVHVDYAASGLPVGASLVLQHEVGTDHVWRTIQKLEGFSGKVNAPRAAQGRYVYRLLALYHGIGYAQSPWKLLFVYAPVSLQTMCNGSDLSINGYCGTGTEQVGSTVYPYAAELYAYLYPQWLDSLDSTSNTTCRLMRLTFAENVNSADGSSYSTNLQLVQETMAPQSASTPADTVGTFVARLDGHPWHLDAASGNNGGVMVNGSFDCYTATGF